MFFLWWNPVTLSILMLVPNKKIFPMTRSSGVNGNMFGAFVVSHVGNLAYTRLKYASISSCVHTRSVNSVMMKPRVNNLGLIKPRVNLITLAYFLLIQVFYSLLIHILLFVYNCKDTAWFYYTCYFPVHWCGYTFVQLQAASTLKRPHSLTHFSTLVFNEIHSCT